MKLAKISAIICVVLFIIDSTYSARILCLYGLSTKSHKNFALPVLEKLAERGHEIIFVSPYKTPTKSPNIRDIIVETDEESISKKLGQKTMSQSVFIPSEKPTFSQMMKKIPEMTEKFRVTAEVFSTNEEVRELLNQKFDLVLYNGIFNDLTLGLIHSLGAPFVEMFPSASLPWITEQTGTPAPPSFTPFSLTPYSSNMTFFERVLNMLITTIFSAFRNCIYLPSVHNSLLTYHPDLPDLRDFERNVSLIITNGHPALSGPKPLLPQVVEAGGVHCRDAKPLPKDLESFISGSGEEGVIYFSLGSVVQGSEMPDEIRLAFLEAFSRLKQRVLWKWETETMEGLPSNVKLSKWLPQQDVLGHPKVKVFMTHGGLLSTQEAVYHGVPLVGIPLFADQGLNMATAEKKGYGVKLIVEEITADKVYNAITEVLNNPSYSKTMKDLSAIFRDQYPPPLDRAVYWIEYVIRHKGAHHLKSIGATLPWYTYHSLDVYAFLITVLFLSLAVLFVCLKSMIRCICSKTDDDNTPKEKVKVY